MSQKINKSKNYTKKYPELKNNITPLFSKLRVDGNNKENNGNKQNNKIEEDINNFRRS